MAARGAGVDGVVFDFDGVIAQSMEAHAEAYRQVLAQQGISIEARDVLLREGARSETILQDLIAGAGSDPDSFDIAALAEEKQAAFLALGRPGLYPGARDMLDRVQAACGRTALVTGTRRTNLEALIPDLLPRFTAVLSQESYSHDKPHPEPYQRAADALAIDPAHCIAVENAIRGVESAKAAGYGHVIAITTTLGRDDLLPTGADAVVSDHAAVAAAVLTVLARQG